MLNNTNRSYELADLVGDYLFTDKAFVQNLSTENRNVFQKVWDEVKYLCKIASAGTQDARKLLEVKKAFEEAYRVAGEVMDIKYSIGEIVDENNNSYGIGVHLDSTLLDNLTPDERKVMVKERIKELGGKVFLLMTTTETQLISLLQSLVPVSRTKTVRDDLSTTT